jgi:NADH:ubiquinone oxidoreductase subunit 2 (subunit N)
MSKLTSVNFFTLEGYKIEILMFASLCALLVLASAKSSISATVRLSKGTMSLLMVWEFVSIKRGGLEMNEILGFSESYKVTIYTQSAKIFILLLAVLLLNMFFMQQDQTHSLLLQLHTLVFLGLMLVSTNNGFLLLIVLESFSLLLYILTLSRKTYGGIAAGVKYFVFGTLGSIIIFWGFVNLYAVIKTVGFGQVD